MSDSDDIDLFAELTAEEEQALNHLAAQRQRDEPSNASALSYQRRRYLQNAFTPTNTQSLKNQPPVNLGQTFTPTQRHDILASLRLHAATEGWTQGRHGAFPTRDVPVSKLSVAEHVRSTLAEHLFPELEARTGIAHEYWAFRDLFIIGYHANHQRALEVHTDGCLASLTMLLNDTEDFVGGGTYFTDFDLLVKQTPGDAWVHDAKLRHSGVEITQ
ncbi:hypothetical protein IW150_001836, partial [Coemansia sp. RSA 2607]